MSEDSYQLAQQTLELYYLQRVNYEHYKQAGNNIETNLANDRRRRKELLKERKRQSDILMSILSSK